MAEATSKPPIERTPPPRWLVRILNPLLERLVASGRGGRVQDQYRSLIEEHGLEEAGRRLGIRINVDHSPARAELEEAVRRSGLSVVWIDLEDGEA